MTEFKKYDKIHRIGHDETKELLADKKATIFIEEKIDGGNFRFYITETSQVIIGSRTQQLTDNQGEDTNMNKMFIACANHVREALKDKDLSRYTKMIFYGENCVKHTISYDWEKIPRFLGFDIYDTGNGIYIDHEKKSAIFESLELQTVPYLGLLKIDRRKNLNNQFEELVPISEYALQSSDDRKAEGIVLKDYDRQIFAKFVRDEFKEKNSEAFGGNPKYNKEVDNDNDEYVFKYCTNQRIEKMIFKLIDEGESLDMPLMKYLPKRVYEDIYEEEYKEIFNTRWKLDLHALRKTITKRCVSVLKTMITNNALN